MPHVFDTDILRGVLKHMNSDHNDDNVLITRAYSDVVGITSAEMTTFDGDGGEWIVSTEAGDQHTVRIPWPGGAITERPEVRREVVALYDGACARLGVDPRPHA